MTVDVALWLILAAMIAWVFCGCVCTAGNRKAAQAQGGTGERGAARDYQVDRAA
jgi:hypothetical protein